MRPAFSRSLNYSIYDGSAHAVMLGMGETYLVTFAIALGFSNFYIGLLASLPMLCAAFAQVLVIDRLIKVTSRRAFILRLALFQAVLWLPIFILPTNFRSPWILICLAVLYYSSSHLIAPLWNSWMGDLVSSKIRGAYFGKRNQYRTIVEMVAFLLAGFILHYVTDQGALWSFGIIFTVAFVARLVSAWFLAKMEEPPYQAAGHEHYFSLKTFLKKSVGNNFGRFVLFAFSLLMVTNIASPFFTAYMLRELHFSYLELSTALACSLFFQFLSFQNWGLIGDRFGNFKVLKITGVAVGFLPLLWLTTQNFYLVLLFQALGGLFWAGFNLAAVNYIFDSVTPQKLARCVSYYNFMGNMGTFLGALLGGLLSKVDFTLLMPTLDLFKGSTYVYYALFLCSGLLRFLVVWIFLSKFKEVKKVESHSTWSVMRHFIGLSLT
ncbi:MAG: MFS transporter, partial [Deltaproteobacteria bacterium]|nr:MFS transporter [Deltaproteobacteria bacterium]